MSKRVLKSRDNCAYCGRMFLMRNDDFIHNRPSSFTIDHLTPKSKGGTNHPDNLVPCCKSCNSKKQSKTLEEYRHYFLRGVLPKLDKE